MSPDILVLETVETGSHCIIFARTRVRFAQATQRDKEIVWCGAGRSTKLLLTWVIDLIIVVSNHRSLPVSIFAVRD